MCAGGRRLKLFVYLSDVGANDGRPTLVARRTHDIIHFGYGWHCTYPQGANP